MDRSIKKDITSTKSYFSAEIISYKPLANGDSLTLHIFRPQHVKEKSSPAIIFFFGGGWKLGTPLQFYRECAYYASKGMVAISADYRIEYLHKSTPFDSFADAQDAIRWLRQHAATYNIDPNKIVAAGASAGGHLAASLGTIGTTNEVSADYKPNLLVLYYPVVDMNFNRYDFPAIDQCYRNISPLQNISNNTPPTIFMVGTKDQIVSIQTAEDFCNTIRKKGVECELHLFKDAGHPIFLYREPLTKNFYKIRNLTDAFLKKNGFLTDTLNASARTTKKNKTNTLSYII